MMAVVTLKLLRSGKRYTNSFLLKDPGYGSFVSLYVWLFLAYFKVWSDFKNNTKKKAARIHRAAVGTGGGPANFSKLTDLEQRVLNLIGMQVATGLAIDEAGFPQVIFSCS